MEQSHTDPELLKRVRASDADAFRALFERYQPIVFRQVMYQLGESDAAHDVVQETFVRIWDHRRSLQPELSFAAYALRISANLVRDAGPVPLEAVPNPHQYGRLEFRLVDRRIRVVVVVPFPRVHILTVRTVRRIVSGERRREEIVRSQRDHEIDVPPHRERALEPPTQADLLRRDVEILVPADEVEVAGEE